jgi:hypothetical protein
MTECRCADESVLWGAAADDYAESHLVRESVAERAREVLYRCPITDRRWVMDIADDEEGGAALRLRWLMSTAELVEHLAKIDEVEEHFAFWHPDIEVHPSGSGEIIRGREAAREWALKAKSDVTAPRATAISLVDQGEQVVVFGSVSLRRAGRYVEHKPAAWLVTGKTGRITRSMSFDTWEEAREAAGLPASGGVAVKELRKRFLFAVREAFTALKALPKLYPPLAGR